MLTPPLARLQQRAVRQTPPGPDEVTSQKATGLQARPLELRGRVARVGLLWNAERIPDPAAPFNSTGAHVAAASMAPALANHGSFLNVDVFVPLSSIDPGHRQLNGLAGHVYGAEGSVARLCPLSELPRRFREQPYDVLHDTATDLTRAAYLRSKLTRRVFPLTCSQHGTSYVNMLHGLLMPILTGSLCECDTIVCLTASSRRAMELRLAELVEQFSQMCGRPTPPLPRLSVIPWGVDAERFAPRDRAAARRDLNLPPDRPIVLCAGRVRIEDKMDWTPLLLAFQRVRLRVKERALLVLAGGTYSEYGKDLEGQAGRLGLREDVRTFFNLPPSALASLYAACDVFVSPTDSPSESFGLTIVEAMACGRPVVASDWDGYVRRVN